MQLNEIKFLENVQRIHLKSDEISIYTTIADADVRVRLNKFVGYDTNPRFSVANMRFSAALDEICANIVGRTMFKVLMTKMKKHHQTMQILEHTDEKYGSYYTKNTVYINLNRYESDGSGKTHRQYYGITKDEKIEPKLKSMAGSMFHEFCHALHDISGTMISSNKICISEELQEVWEDDEELRTITCFEHDPICDHCFDFVQSILKSKPFLPRSSHNLGYRSRKPLDDAENREKLLQHFLKYKILLEGWREYTL